MGLADTGVDVGKGVLVIIGVLVGSGVFVIVAVLVDSGVFVGIGVSVDVGDAVGVNVIVGEAVGVRVGNTPSDSPVVCIMARIIPSPTRPPIMYNIQRIIVPKQPRRFVF